jgi:integrase
MGRRSLTELRYVNAFVDRTGCPRYYFRRHGKRTPLPGLPGSQEFMQAYGAALTDQPPPRERRPAPLPLTFAALAARYFSSPQYLALAATSRTNYRRVIDSFLVEHGHRRVKQMTREHVDVIVGKLAGTPGAGIVLLKRLRTLVRYAMAIGWTDRDVTAGVKGYRSKEVHTWSEDEITVFERRWLQGTRQRLAFALLLYTGQRGCDVHRMVWADIAGDTIRVTQRKTGAKLVIPLHSSLRATLAMRKREHVAILTTAYERPFSLKGFGNLMSEAIAQAGLPPRCKAHGLRKAAARRLAEAGATSKQIGAITGHKTLAEVERYTRASDQEHLARQAIEKQEANANWQIPSAAVANRDTNN